MHFVKLYLDAKSANDYVHASLTDEEKERYKDLFFFMHKAETCIDGSVEITLVGTPSDNHPIEATTQPRRKFDIQKLIHTHSSELMPCPFCGGKASILVCDDEGNIHDESYEQDPWSGLGYMLQHTREDVPEDIDCPIATSKGEGLGMLIYDTREEATEVWNKGARQ